MGLIGTGLVMDADDAGNKRNEFRSTVEGRLPFQPFDEHRAVRVYVRNLPHWRQEGATYFVTFRLGDSIPANVLRQWEYEKQKWLAARGIECGQGDDWKTQVGNLTAREQFLFHKHFNRLFHISLDQCQGACLLRHSDCVREVRSKLREIDATTCEVGDFVVMPNHVHVLLTPWPGQKLESVMKAIKGATARKCNALLNRTGSFWQADSYDHIVRSLEQLQWYRGYIAANPEKAGVAVPDDGAYRAEWMDEWFKP